jgi:electron transfer flavoprotein beta subunit
MRVMKLLVAIKRVLDYNVKIRVKSDGSDVELANVKMGINPFCEIAVEEGVRLREAGIATELVVGTGGGGRAVAPCPGAGGGSGPPLCDR